MLSVATSHDLKYLYEGEKPDAASQIGEDRYTYDDNGNPTLIVSDSTTSTITWDEENRMVMLNDDGYVSRYTYDFCGTRVTKSHGPQESVYINGAEQGLDYHDADNYTLYVSPYLIVNNERFTKHYYAGTQRIASKVGSGDFYNVYGVNGFHLTAGDKDYKERLEQIEEGVKEYYNANGIPPGEPTMKGSNADPYVADVALPNAELGDYSVPTDWPTNVKFNEPGDVPGPVVQFEDEDLGDVKTGYGFESDNLYEGDWFFFHTDHLGSTSYLTDTAGNVSQFVCYTPYGEAIVDEHLTTYENPFKFSGKELDDITGLYDHGARSRNPISTLWYGIDPLWEKYPDFSPYNYCAGNPVKLVDPDGRDWLKSNGYKLYWFAGEYGDESQVVRTYDICSGNDKGKLEGANGEKVETNCQFGKYQQYKNAGPTPEGEYHLNLYSEVIQAPDGISASHQPTLVPSTDPKASIENIPEVSLYQSDWGKHRINLKADNILHVGPLQRNYNLFYFHDSNKGYTHGCTEVPEQFFEDLSNYIQDNHSEEILRLKIEYDGSQTNYRVHKTDEME